jgi:hypothetical protein
MIDQDLQNVIKRAMAASLATPFEVELCEHSYDRTRCRQCEEARELRRTSLDTIPRSYRWARVDAPELSERVACCDPVANLAREIAKSSTRTEMSSAMETFQRFFQGS